VDAGGRIASCWALFEKHKGVTDEITFFTSATHPPLPLEEIKRRCEILARRIPQAKGAGVSSGDQRPVDDGHHNENLPNSLSGDYTRVTDIDGNVSLGSFCRMTRGSRTMLASCTGWWPQPIPTTSGRRRRAVGRHMRSDRRASATVAWRFLSRNRARSIRERV